MIKKVFLLVTLIVVGGMVRAQKFTPRSASTNANQAVANMQRDQIRWTTISSAAQLKDNDKLYFIDFYTSWCGWCKRMDADVFTDATVVKLINKYFVPIKFNAEGQSELVWHGTRYVGTPTPRGSRPQVHSFAKATLGKDLGFPSFGVFGSDQQLITVIQGYQPVNDMTMMLWFIASGDYKIYSYDKYQAIFDKTIRPQMEEALKK